MSRRLPPLVTLEEHFLSTAVVDDRNGPYAEQFKHLPGLGEKLQDLDTLRLQSMDENQISVQVVSHGPGALPPDQCIAANDQLAAAVRRHPKRYAGFAVLPVADPKSCAHELTRCVRDLGFVGALVDNHTTDGKYFDTPDYDVFWQAAQELDVPVYLHPTWPSDPLRDVLYSSPGLTSGANASLSTSGFGWHTDVGLHVLRLFAAGTFDRFSKLKIIIGHMGETLPFMLHRVIQLSPRWGKRDRVWRTVWDENIWITTSGVWDVSPMATILSPGNTKIERVLYSVDYPFAKNEDGVKFMEALRESGLVDEAGFEKIAWRNAAELMKISVA